MVQFLDRPRGGKRRAGHSFKPKARRLELFLVVDCSGHTETSEWMFSNNIVAEVDYNTALRWNTVGRGIKVEIARLQPVKYLPE